MVIDLPWLFLVGDEVLRGWGPDNYCDFPATQNATFCRVCRRSKYIYLHVYIESTRPSGITRCYNNCLHCFGALTQQLQWKKFMEENLTQKIVYLIQTCTKFQSSLALQLTLRTFFQSCYLNWKSENKMRIHDLLSLWFISFVIWLVYELYPKVI